MSQDSLQTTPRRSFLSRLNTGIATLAAMAGAGMAQENAAAGSRWEPARHEKDNWLDQNQAKHRMLFDTTSFEIMGDAIAFASNIFRTNRTDYGLEDKDVAVLIVARHRSAPFGYNDAIWAKYGELLAARAKMLEAGAKAPKVNFYYAAGSDRGSNRGNSLSSLAKLGTQFAVCQLSTRAIAGGIASATGQKTDEVFAEISANLIPNSRLVPAGIVAVNRAQERGYTLMSI